jgi:tRNA (guanosine-2'-O-)-methyltransferase
MTATTMTTVEIREQRKALYRPTADPLLWIAVLWPKTGENLGTLLRTCDAFGAGMIAPLGSDATRALTKGNTIGVDKVPMIRIADPIRYLKQAHNDGCRIIGLEIAHGSQALQSFRLDGRKTVLVVGHENWGIPQEAWQFIPEAAEIGQRGIGNCLNVAVAGSIALWWLSLDGES